LAQSQQGQQGSSLWQPNSSINPRKYPEQDDELRANIYQAKRAFQTR
jgi:hypothetical protein